MYSIDYISAAIASLKTAIDITKLIKESGVSLEEADDKLKLAELMSALADTKIKIAEVQQTLIDKDSEIRRLQEQLTIKGELKYDAPYYWLVTRTKRMDHIVSSATIKTTN